MESFGQKTTNFEFLPDFALFENIFALSISSKHSFEPVLKNLESAKNSAFLYTSMWNCGKKFYGTYECFLLILEYAQKMAHFQIFFKKWKVIFFANIYQSQF
jgi:hypothetical protein